MKLILSVLLLTMVTTAPVADGSKRRHDDQKGSDKHAQIEAVVAVLGAQ